MCTYNTKYSNRISTVIYIYICIYIYIFVDILIIIDIHIYIYEAGTSTYYVNAFSGYNSNSTKRQ